MKVIIDQKLIKRNKLIGQIATYGSLAVLALGLYLSYKQIYITWSFLALMMGFIISQLGIYYGSRWGRSPRPDETLTAALKGLDNKYLLYHYASPVHHLLVGPAGIWILAPYQQAGTITYDSEKNRWKQKGGNMFLKVFAQEGLGRPDLEIQHLKRVMDKFLNKEFQDDQIPNVEAVLVFTNNKAVIEVENPPVSLIPAKKLKEFIRRQAKGEKIEQKTMEELINKLPQTTIEA